MIDTILQRLSHVRGSKGVYRARCPAHGSTGLTLSIKDAGGGRTLMHCHAGCDIQSIVHAIGLQITDLYPTDHDFTPKTRSVDYERAFLAVAQSDVAAGRRLSHKEKQAAIDAAYAIRNAK